MTGTSCRWLTTPVIPDLTSPGPPSSCASAGSLMTSTKSFFLYDGACFTDRAGVFATDLAISLDVIYHLTEDEIFETYLTHLFAAATRFVIIYATNLEISGTAPHVRHRRFTPWVDSHCASWRLLNVKEGPNSSGLGRADFFSYMRVTPPTDDGSRLWPRGSADITARGEHRTPATEAASSRPDVNLPRYTTAGEPSPGEPSTGPADARPASEVLPGPAAGQRRCLLQDVTTRDLSGHGHQLDQALKRTTTDDPAREQLQQQLTLIHAILRTRPQAPTAQRRAAARPPRPGIYDLTARIFRGLFTDFDLHRLRRSPQRHLAVHRHQPRRPCPPDQPRPTSGIPAPTPPVPAEHPGRTPGSSIHRCRQRQQR